MLEPLNEAQLSRLSTADLLRRMILMQQESAGAVAGTLQSAVQGALEGKAPFDTAANLGGRLWWPNKQITLAQLTSGNAVNPVKLWQPSKSEYTVISHITLTTHASSTNQVHVLKERGVNEVAEGAAITPGTGDLPAGYSSAITANVGRHYNTLYWGGLIHAGAAFQKNLWPGYFVMDPDESLFVAHGAGNAKAIAVTLLYTQVDTKGLERILGRARS